MLRTRFERRIGVDSPVGLVSEIIQDPEQIRWIDPEHKYLLDHPEIREWIAKDQIPIPSTSAREGYYDERHFAYWMSGLHDWQTLLELVPDADKSSAILDLGGASGRVARHALRDAPASRRVYLAEININHVELIQKHFPRSVIPFKVTSVPPLMLPDSSVDLAFAYSVFTHTDVFETSWLLELRRVIRPSGHAVITVHSEHTWDALSEAHVLEALQRNEEFNKTYKPGASMPGDRLVFEFDGSNEDHHYTTNVFHSSEYIRSQWSRAFEVVTIEPCKSCSRQSVVVLRRTE